MKYAFVERVQKVMAAYHASCRALCQEHKLTQTAFDILMFLGNHPGGHTARDIVQVRHIKANLVSVNVDRLVREGYLLRQPIPGDRRKVLLVLTEQSEPIVSQGRRLQEAFFGQLFAGIDPKDQEAFRRVIDGINRNIDNTLTGENEECKP